jgi:hypothetical protein
MKSVDGQITAPNRGRFNLVALGQPVFPRSGREYRNRGITYIQTTKIADMLVHLADDSLPMVVLIDVDTTSKIAMNDIHLALDIISKRNIPLIIQGELKNPRQKLLFSAINVAAVLPSLVPFDTFIHTVHKSVPESKGRRDPRISAELDALVGVDNISNAAKIHDLSVSGALVVGHCNIEKGSLLRVSFELPRNKKKIDAIGVVARLVSENTDKSLRAIGVQFTGFVGTQALG